MADELNMQSKHSIEKKTAHYVDCFTTVSDITAMECKELLDRPVDVVLPNGFEDDFVPKATLLPKNVMLHANDCCILLKLLQVLNSTTMLL